MSKNDFTTLIEKLFRGQTDENENKELEKALGNESDGIFDDYCRERWDDGAETGGCRKAVPEAVKAEMKRNILAQIRKQDTDRPGRAAHTSKSRIIYWATGVAAALALAFTTGLKVSDANHPAQQYTVVADRGQKSVVDLPDGSRVRLNSASRITYSSDFNRKDRNISLEGEAFFEVAKNKKIPFIVTADKVTVKAVGTRFNVMAYRDRGEIVTTLVEGEVITAAGPAADTLLPRRQSHYSRTTGLMTTTDAPNEEHLVPWTANEILLADESLADVAGILEKMYDVNIIFADEEIKGYSYTGLIRNNSLMNVLDLITGTSPVKYRISNNTIKFSRKDQ